jgi:hypothetical protein
MDFSTLISTLVGGGVIGVIIEVVASIRYRRQNATIKDAEAAQKESEATQSSVEAQKAQMDLADLYKEKVLGLIELINTKQDNGTAKQDRMIQMLGSLDARVDSLEVRVGKIEGKMEENSRGERGDRGDILDR